MLGSNDNNYNTGKLFVLKIKGQDENKKPVPAFFEVSEKDEALGKWVKTTTTNSVTGKVTKVDHKQSEFNGDVKDFVNVFLRDEENSENYLLSLSLSIINKSLLNSLFNLQDFDTPITIQLYKQKGKDFSAAAVRQGKELIRWKYSVDQLPKPNIVKIKGKETKDWFEIDQFFISEAVALGERIQNREPVAATTASEDDGDDFI